MDILLVSIGPLSSHIQAVHSKGEMKVPKFCKYSSSVNFVKITSCNRTYSVKQNDCVCEKVVVIPITR